MFCPSLLLAPLSSCSFVSGCGIHPGFATAWEEISDDVLAALQSATALYPAHDIIVTGHSLGGAVATIAAGHLRQEGFFIDLYTYGSPRVGNLAFVTFITNQDGEEYRVTHSDDPVPQVPPMFLSYRHVSPEYCPSNSSSLCPLSAVSGALGSKVAPNLLPSPPTRKLLADIVGQGLIRPTQGPL